MGAVRRIKIICKKSMASCMCRDQWCISWVLDWRIKKWVSVIWEKAGRCYSLASPMTVCGNFWSLNEYRESFPGSRNSAAAAQSPAGWFYSKIPQLFWFTLPNSMIRHTGFHTTRTRWMLLPRRPGLIASVSTEDSCGCTLQKNSKGEFDIYLQMKRTDKHSGK